MKEFDDRMAIAEKLEELDIFKKIIGYKLRVPTCYTSDTRFCRLSWNQLKSILKVLNESENNES